MPTKEFYWVTDGQGRQYAMAEATGGWEQDFNANNWPGFPQAGGIQDATGYNAGRSQGSNVPGVSYFRNRIYDQQSGQWTQEDPIGLAGGLNLYQYAGGNPAMFTDPWGLKEEGGNDCKKVKCPEPLTVIRDPEVLKRANEMYRQTLKDGKERGAVLYNGPNGTVVVGPTLIGTADPGDGMHVPTVPGLATLPENAIGSLHTHPAGAPDTPVGPSGNDADHAKANNVMVVVRDRGALFILNTDGTAAYRMPASIRQNPPPTIP